MQPYHTWAEIGTSIRTNRTLVFVRGFHGLNDLTARVARFGLGRLALTRLGYDARSRSHQTTWYRAVRSYGYRSRLFSFRWFSPSSDCLSPAAREERIDEAAEKLWEYIQEEDIPTHTISLLGYSQGASIIQRLLRVARSDSVIFRRVYFFGGTARRHARWSELLECVSGRVWNFHSENDPVLQRYHPDCIGLYGLLAYYPRTRDIDCRTFISDHDEWRSNAEYCLQRARLNPLNL